MDGYCFKQGGHIEELASRLFRGYEWYDAILMAAGICKVELLFNGLNQGLADWLMRNPSVASFLQAIVTTCRNDKRIERTVANRAYAFGFILNLMTFSKVADAANAANASWFTKTQTAARSFANVATKLGFASHPKKAVRNATAIPSQAGKQISPSVAQSSDLLPNPETSTEELNINEDITYSEAIETLEMIVDQRRAKGRSTHGQTKSGEHVHRSSPEPLEIASQKPSSKNEEEVSFEVIDNESFRLSIQSLIERISRFNHGPQISPLSLCQILSNYILWINQSQIFNKRIAESLVGSYLTVTTNKTECSLEELRQLVGSLSDQILGDLGPEFLRIQSNPEQFEIYARSLELLLDIKSNALSVSIESWKAVLQNCFIHEKLRLSTETT